MIAEDIEQTGDSNLTDERGEACYYDNLNGVANVGSGGNTSTSNFSPINANSQKVLSYNSGSGCYFLGNTFNFSDNLWIYNTVTQKKSKITFSFTNVAIPN